MEKQNLYTSSFKYFLLKFLTPSVLIVGIMLLGFDYWFDHKIIFKTETSGAYKIHRNKDISITSEIPIFGSSRAAGSYIPDLIDSNCYNYGIEKTEHLLIEVFLKNEYAKNKTTPIIVNLDYESWTDWIGDWCNYIPNLDNAEISRLFEKHDHWYYHVKGIRYFGYYQFYIKNYMGARSKKNHVNKGGFFLLEKTPKTDLDEEIKLREKMPMEYYPNEVVENEFCRLVSENHGRKIFIVVAPYHNSIMKNIIGKPSADVFFEKLKKIPNVYFFDYSSTPYPDAYFKNTTHLNFLGAKQFSAELKEKFHQISPEYFN
jgi:hypothetical protein